MPISSKGSLLSFLGSLGRGAKKSLSQNFLIDGNIAQKIVKTMPCTRGDTVFEIGPGPGVLTEIVLKPPQGFSFESPEQLVAIEKDDQFAQALYRFQPESEKRFRIVHGDFFDVIESELQGVVAKKKGEIHLISNIPYQITSKFFEKIFSMNHRFSSITLMIQEEVARKIVQPVGSKQASFLSIFLAYHTEKMSYAFFVPKSCFFPAPKVDSAVVHLVPRQTPLLAHNEETHFFSLVQRAFSMKRKTVKSSLREHGIELEKANLPQSIRPQEMDIDAWLHLFAMIYQQ